MRDEYREIEREEDKNHGWFKTNRGRKSTTQEPGIQGLLIVNHSPIEIWRFSHIKIGPQIIFDLRLG